VALVFGSYDVGGRRTRSQGTQIATTNFSPLFESVPAKAMKRQANNLKPSRTVTNPFGPGVVCLDPRHFFLHKNSTTTSDGNSKFSHNAPLKTYRCITHSAWNKQTSSAILAHTRRWGVVTFLPSLASPALGKIDRYGLVLETVSCKCTSHVVTKTRQSKLNTLRKIVADSWDRMKTNRDLRNHWCAACGRPCIVGRGTFCAQWILSLFDAHATVLRPPSQQESARRMYDAV